jgi:hypothetical protein
LRALIIIVAETGKSVATDLIFFEERNIFCVSIFDVEIEILKMLSYVGGEDGRKSREGRRKTRQRI